MDCSRTFSIKLDVCLIARTADGVMNIFVDFKQSPTLI